MFFEYIGLFASDSRFEISAPIQTLVFALVLASVIVVINFMLRVITSSKNDWLDLAVRSNYNEISTNDTSAGVENVLEIIQAQLESFEKSLVSDYRSCDVIPDSNLKLPHAIVDSFSKIFNLWYRNPVFKNSIKSDVFYNVFSLMFQSLNNELNEVCDETKSNDNALELTAICEICDQQFKIKNNDLKSSYAEHVQTPYHIETTNTFRMIGRSANNDARETENNTSNSNINENSLKNDTYLNEWRKRYIEKDTKNGAKYFCHLCKIDINEAYVTAHITHKWHRYQENLVNDCYQVLKEHNYFVELIDESAFDYECHLCDVKNRGYAGLIEHCISDKHFTSIGQFLYHLPQANKERLIAPVESFIFPEPSGEWYCAFCTLHLTQLQRNRHKNDPYHKNNEKFALEILKMEKPYIRHLYARSEVCSCELCDTKFPAMNGIISHCKTTNHIERKKFAREIETINSKILEQKKQIENEKTPENPDRSKNEVEKFIIHDSNRIPFPNLCQINLSDKGNIATQVQGFMHKSELKILHQEKQIVKEKTPEKSNTSKNEVEKFIIHDSKGIPYCNLCQINLSNKGNITSHVEGFMHKSKRKILHQEKQIGNEKKHENINPSKNEVENFIIHDGKGIPYCNLCQINLSNKGNVTSHVQGFMHKSKLKILDQEKQIGNVKKSENTNSSKNDVEKCIIHDSKGIPYCNLCQINLSNKGNIATHLQGFMHKSKLKILDQEKQIGNLKKPEISNPSKNEVDIFIIYNSNGIPYCNLCDINLENIGNIAPHVQGSTHKSKLKILHKEKQIANEKTAGSSNASKSEVDTLIIYDSNGIPYYNLCNIDLDNKGNIAPHVRGSVHKSKFKTLHQEKQIENEKTAVSSNASKNEVNTIIIYDSNGIPYCNLCNIDLDNKGNIASHVQGFLHKSKFKTLLHEKQIENEKSSENIKPSENEVDIFIIHDDKGIPYCNLCQINLSNKGNIATHVQGFMHKSKSKILHQEKRTGNEQKPEGVNLLENEVDRFIFYDIKGIPYCNLCQINLSNKGNISTHVQGFMHKSKFKTLHQEKQSGNAKKNENINPLVNEVEKFIIHDSKGIPYCNLCNINLDNEGNIASHVQGFTHTFNIKSCQH